jgi:branched-chain amino acid aminotransferase
MMTNEAEANIVAWRLTHAARLVPERLAAPQKDAITVEQSNPERVSLYANSLDSAALQLPGGAYTTFRTFRHFHVLLMIDHFERLEETARLVGLPVRLNRERIRMALRYALDRFLSEEARVRVTLDLVQEVGTVYLTLEKLHVPSEVDYIQGVRVATRFMQRQNPKAKLTSFIETAARVRHALPAAINEAIMIGEDECLLEGLSSNFFAVLNGVVWTAEKGVLSGITRSMVLEAIQQLDIPLRLECLPVEKLALISEAFITSASRAVLPVTEIDGKQVGSGRPGPVTQRLLGRYRQIIEQSLETV